MKSKVYNLLIIVLLLGYSFSVQGGAMAKKSQSEVSAIQITEMQVETERRIAKDIAKRQHRMVKRVKRIVQKILKKNNSFGSVWRSSKFRWGCLLLLLGLVGAILVNLFSLAQIFGWLTGILAVAGLAFMMWGLIDHS